MINVAALQTSLEEYRMVLVPEALICFTLPLVATVSSECICIDRFFTLSFKTQFEWILQARATQMTADNSRRAGEVELERIRREHEENQVKLSAKMGGCCVNVSRTCPKAKRLDSERSDIIR